MAMVRKLIEMKDELDRELARLAETRGQSESELIDRAVELLLEEAREGEPEITDPAEVAAIRAEVAGMWRDRTDLPDIRELRKGWEKRLSRLFGDDE